MSDIVSRNESYVFASAQSFEACQRMATALSKSTLVPKEYQNNMPNALIALEVAHRIGASPLMVMQNLYIVHGRPSWSSQFIIAAINSCGRFSPLRFEITGEGEDFGCIASVKDKNGEELKGPRVSISMAKKEGWYDRNGSKWKTMPEVMLRYRSASFFGKLYAPEILMGMQTLEESEDIDIKDVTPAEPQKSGVEGAKEKLRKKNPETVLETSEHEPIETEREPVLTMHTGEMLRFPGEINIPVLMQTLQDIGSEDAKQFFVNNQAELPRIVKLMKLNGKDAAAKNLEKLIETYM